MAKLHWKERFNDGGICDFKLNYNFYFKWLLNKVCSCFYITGLPETVNEYYIKSTLITDGDIGITEFNSKLYAVNGAPAGQPDEYYIPEQYVVANPRLGSKTFTRGIDGVVIYNTDTDQYISGGLYGLISQTATLLADNIISINCAQINSRVQVMLTADDDNQVIAGETALKKMYAGKPYTILKSDLVDKININPINNSCANNLTELVELHNYIVGNFFQSIGVKSNNIRKKAHILEDEIDAQDGFLQLSIFEILTSWQKGFDAVNALYGTDIQVNLNPALISEILPENTDCETESNDSDIQSNTELETESTDENTETDEISSTDEADVETESIENNDIETNVDLEQNTESVVDNNSVVDEIIDETEALNEIVDVINDIDDESNESEAIEDESESDSSNA